MVLNQSEFNHKYKLSQDYEQIDVDSNGKLLIKHLMFTIWNFLAAAQILFLLKFYQSYTVIYIICH